MTTLTTDAMGRLHGAAYVRLRGGSCGFMVGAMLLTMSTGHLIAAASIYMFTPVTCLFDFAR